MNNDIQQLFSDVDEQLFELCSTLMAMKDKDYIMNLIDDVALSICMEPDCLASWQHFEHLDVSEFAYMMEKEGNNE